MDIERRFKHVMTYNVSVENEFVYNTFRAYIDDH
jgi:hypothetical protein